MLRSFFPFIQVLLLEIAFCAKFLGLLPIQQFTSIQGILLIKNKVCVQSISNVLGSEMFFSILRIFKLNNQYSFVVKTYTHDIIYNLNIFWDLSLISHLNVLKNVYIFLFPLLRTQENMPYTRRVKILVLLPGHIVAP